nr:hypothetical protein [Grimontia kaedaensis]
MFSQSLFAQLVRWLLVLIVTLVSVQYCTPLQRAFADYAVDGGCHQHHQMNNENQPHGSHITP